MIFPKRRMNSARAVKISAPQTTIFFDPCSVHQPAISGGETEMLAYDRPFKTLQVRRLHNHKMFRKANKIGFVSESETCS